jgi:hypothetical protein
MSITTAQIYWAAGIMEGEGYFGLRRGRDLVAQLSMTDKDVVEKFHAIFPTGKIKQRVLPSGKIAYTWLATAQSVAAGIFMTLLPLMGKRRAEKIIQCLTEWKKKPLPMKMWTHCKNGHELKGANMRINKNGKYMKRTCTVCQRERQAAYRLKQRAEPATITITWNASGIFAL